MEHSVDAYLERISLDKVQKLVDQSEQEDTMQFDLSEGALEKLKERIRAGI